MACGIGYASLPKVTIIQFYGRRWRDGPGHFVIMNEFRGSMPVIIHFAFEEPATAAENRVVADVAQVVSQVIHTVQSAVAIPASEVPNHLAGEWVGESRNAWVIDPVKLPTITEILNDGLGLWHVARRFWARRFWTRRCWAGRFSAE